MPRVRLDLKPQTYEAWQRGPSKNAVRLIGRPKFSSSLGSGLATSRPPPCRQPRKANFRR